jgi:surface antigen
MPWFSGSAGDALNWASSARNSSNHYLTGPTPAIGAVVVLQPGVYGATSAGHVAIVSDLYYENSVLKFHIREKNGPVPCGITTTRGLAPDPTLVNGKPKVEFIYLPLSAPQPPAPPAVVALGGVDVDGYCRSVGLLGYDVVTDPDYQRFTAYSLRCKTSSGDVGVSMYLACQWQYHRTDSVDVMRNFNSTTDWKCYPITGLVGKVQPSDVTNWCNYVGYAGYSVVQQNAYGIWCKDNGGGIHPVDMQWLCQWKAGKNNVIDVMRDYNNVWDWNCYGVN